MKQITAIIIVLAMIFLCGCTGEKSESNTTEATTSEPLIKTEKTNAAETYFPYTLSEVEQDETFFYANEITVDPADPYSAFIKKSCEEKAEVWKRCAERDGNTTRNFYSHITSQDDFYYFLYDINGDDTDELLLGSFRKTGEPTESPTPLVKIVITNVCTIKNGEVVILDDQRRWTNEEFIWDRILMSNGIIVTKWGEKDTPNYYIIDYENGKLVRKCYIFKESPDSGFYKVTNDDTFETQKISMSEYESIYNDLCGDAKKVDIDWKRIDEYGT